jgi:hypothetical protein
MVVLLFLVEVEILDSLDAPERGKLMVAAAGAYRERSNCLRKLGRLKEATLDTQRAAQLEQDARKLAAQQLANANQAGEKSGQLELVNEWREGITLHVDGVGYTLEIGETKRLTRPAGTFRYELRSSGQNSVGTIEAGKTFRLVIR